MIWLLILFLFQSAMAGGFTYFVATLVVKDVPQKVLRKVRNYCAVVTVVLSSAVFMAFYKSVPEGEPASHAVGPAVWLFCILGAITLALAFAVRKGMPDYCSQPGHGR
jgi:uncharacterized membrane-anchored protein